MNKTLYIPDDEAETWEKARRLANDKLSPVILKAIKQFVAAKEAEATGFERIQVAFEDSDDNHLPKIKAFHGKWIIPYEKPLECWDDDEPREGISYSVAVTPKGNVVVFMWRMGGGGRWGRRFLVFPSFEEAARNNDVNYAIRQAILKRGVPIEELDI